MVSQREYSGPQKLDRCLSSESLEKCYPLVGSFVTIPNPLKAIHSNSFSVYPRKIGSTSAVVLITIGHESPKLVEFKLI